MEYSEAARSNVFDHHSDCYCRMHQCLHLLTCVRRYHFHVGKCPGYQDLVIFPHCTYCWNGLASVPDNCVVALRVAALLLSVENRKDLVIRASTLLLLIHSLDQYNYTITASAGTTAPQQSYTKCSLHFMDISIHLF